MTETEGYWRRRSNDGDGTDAPKVAPLYPMPKWQGVLIAIGLLLFAIALFAGLDKAGAQDMYDAPGMVAHGGHAPEDQELHEKFYNTWKRPDMRAGDNGVGIAPWQSQRGMGVGDRYASCCSSEDCEPVTALRSNNGHYEVQTKRTPEWTPIPDKLIEQNYNDPKESPDGRTHVCINRTTGVVLCFTLGGGT